MLVLCGQQFTLKFNHMQINEEVILKVMSNYHAAQIVNEKTILRKSELGPLTSTEEIPILEYVKIFDFDTEMVTGILYCREVKLRFEHQFNEVVDEIEKVPENDFQKKLDIMSFEKLLKLLYQTTDDQVHVVLKKLFPTLPILTVPGNRRPGPRPFYVLFTTPTLSNEFDFAFISRLNRIGLCGANVIALSMQHIGAKLLYALAKANKLNAIFNYYLNGDQYNNWDWIMQNLYHADLQEEVRDAFKRINLNTVGGSLGMGGISEGIFQNIAGELALAK